MTDESLEFRYGFLRQAAEGYDNFSDGAWLLMGLQLLALIFSGLYRSVLRHAGTELLVLLLRSVLLGAGLFA